MRVFRSLRSRVDWLFRRGTAEEDLSAELQDYVANETEKHLANGLSPEQARLAALRELGGMEQVKEECRDARRTAWLESTIQDLRYGLRTFSKIPLFTALAVISLALGIGANTAMYSVMYAMMIRALPVRNPSELLILNWHAKQEPVVIQSHTGSSYAEPGGGKMSPDFPWPVYESLRKDNNVFSTLFAYQNAGQLSLSAHGQAGVGNVELISGNFFSGLGLVPAVGRLITEADNVSAASQVAVISYNYWHNQFSGDSAAVGQTVRINDIPFTVVGVAAPEFFGIRPGVAPALFVLL